MVKVYRKLRAQENIDIIRANVVEGSKQFISRLSQKANLSEITIGRVLGQD